MQITNFEDGIYLSDVKASLIDCNGDELKDITSNFYYKNLDSYQVAFEIVSINDDFGFEKVYLKIQDARVTYYSNAFIVTDTLINETSYFEYKNYCDFMGISYEAAKMYQSIRLSSYFDFSVNENEFKSFYQLGQNKSISARPLIKEFERYKIDYLDSFTYNRVNTLLSHDIIYINNKRVSNKSQIKTAQRQENSNFISSEFTVSIDYSDKKCYDFQIFKGVEVVKYQPYGNYSIGATIPSIEVTFNANVELNNGVIKLYSISGKLIKTFYSESFIIEGNKLKHLYPSTANLPVDGKYYFTMSDGLVSFLGEGLKGVSSSDEWWYNVRIADFDKRHFNSKDMFTD